jgi:hypothetical protein
MRLGGRRAGNVTMFVDAFSEEVLLKILVNESGACLVSYRLYDASGRLVADSPVPQAFPEGLLIRSNDDELLLEIPQDEEEHICYRLYGRSGELLTNSDGKHTAIYPNLRMDGKTAGPYRSNETAS